MHDMREGGLCISRTAIFLIGATVSSFCFVGCGGTQQSTSGVPTGTPAVSTAPFERSLAIDLSSSTSISPQATFTLTNLGSEPSVMPSVVLKGQPALNRSSILYAVRGLKDEDFARTTWQIVIDNHNHYCEAGTIADPNDVGIEPMRLLNGYDGMCCDQSSEVLIWLWQGAGYRARFVDLDFHGVPEIFYGGDWHMFDADHHVYYLRLDNKTVANVADLVANPTLVSRVADANGNDPVGYPAQQMADQYAASNPVYDDFDYHSQNIFLLQPGQSLSINYANIVPVFQGVFPEPDIPPAATGSFDWELDYSKPYWKTLASATKGITVIGTGSSALLTNSGPSTGYAVYPFSSPFPVFNLTVSALVDLADSNSAVKAYFSTDGNSWSNAFSLGNGGQATADLSSVAQGQYIYFVKLELSGDQPHTARISNVRIASDFQDSIFEFPALVPGQVNQVTYEDWSSSSGGHDVQVSFTGQSGLARRP